MSSKVNNQENSGKVLLVQYNTFYCSVYDSNGNDNSEDEFSTQGFALITESVWGKIIENYKKIFEYLRDKDSLVSVMLTANITKYYSTFEELYRDHKVTKLTDKELKFFLRTFDGVIVNEEEEISSWFGFFGMTGEKLEFYYLPVEEAMKLRSLKYDNETGLN